MDWFNFSKPSKINLYKKKSFSSVKLFHINLPLFFHLWFLCIPRICCSSTFDFYVFRESELIIPLFGRNIKNTTMSIYSSSFADHFGAVMTMTIVRMVRFELKKIKIKILCYAYLVMNRFESWIVVWMKTESQDSRFCNICAQIMKYQLLLWLERHCCLLEGLHPTMK